MNFFKVYEKSLVYETTVPSVEGNDRTFVASEWMHGMPRIFQNLISEDFKLQVLQHLHRSLHEKAEDTISSKPCATCSIRAFY
ncbi:hypothetical protein TNCV_285871 [Trichonephila clavipes]|nr:hypothetical protein TNCV_285871 [Trichonephila clavipes]